MGVPPLEPNKPCPECGLFHPCKTCGGSARPKLGVVAGGYTRDEVIKLLEAQREACAVQVRGEWIVYESEAVPNEVRATPLVEIP